MKTSLLTAAGADKVLIKPCTQFQYRHRTRKLREL
jgi:hypothetical protein